MKKLMFLLVAGTMFVVSACNCGAGDAATTDSVEEVVACADDCQKACCLGCKATVGDAKCIVLADGSMPCCVEKSEATCCCGDETCDGSCHGDAEAAEEVHSHEGDTSYHSH